MPGGAKSPRPLFDMTGNTDPAHPPDRSLGENCGAPAHPAPPPAKQAESTCSPPAMLERRFRPSRWYYGI